MTVAKTGKALVVANFGSAGFPPTVVSFPILPDGRLGEAVSALAKRRGRRTPVPRDANGNSPTDTHDHCIIRSPDSRFVLVCNLGLGNLYLSVERQTGAMERNGEPFVVPSPTGGGLTAAPPDVQRRRQVRLHPGRRHGGGHRRL